MTKFQYALSGIIFCLVALITLAIFGDTPTKGWVVIAAVLLGYSQFAAQTNSRTADIVSISSVYIALVITVFCAIKLLLVPI